MPFFVTDLIGMSFFVTDLIGTELVYFNGVWRMEELRTNVLAMELKVFATESDCETSEKTHEKRLRMSNVERRTSNVECGT